MMKEEFYHAHGGKARSENDGNCVIFLDGSLLEGGDYGRMEEGSSVTAEVRARRIHRIWEIRLQRAKDEFQTLKQNALGEGMGAASRSTARLRPDAALVIQKLKELKETIHALREKVTLAEGEVRRSTPASAFEREKEANREDWGNFIDAVKSITCEGT